MDERILDALIHECFATSASLQANNWNADCAAEWVSSFTRLLSAPNHPLLRIGPPGNGRPLHAPVLLYPPPTRLVSSASPSIQTTVAAHIEAARVSYKAAVLDHSRRFPTRGLATSGVVGAVSVPADVAERVDPGWSLLVTAWSSPAAICTCRESPALWWCLDHLSSSLAEARVACGAELHPCLRHLVTAFALGTYARIAPAALCLALADADQWVEALVTLTLHSRRMNDDVAKLRARVGAGTAANGTTATISVIVQPGMSACPVPLIRLPPPAIRLFHAGGPVPEMLEVLRESVLACAVAQYPFSRWMAVARITLNQPKVEWRADAVDRYLRNSDHAKDPDLHKYAFMAALLQLAIDDIEGARREVPERERYETAYGAFITRVCRDHHHQTGTKK